MSYATNSQNHTAHALPHRAPTPYLVEPPPGSYYIAPEPQMGAYPYPPPSSSSSYSNHSATLNVYPPHYTAPTPRYMTPTPEPGDAGAYPTPDASPNMRGKYKKLAPEGGDLGVLCAALREGKGSGGGNKSGGQGQGDASKNGQGEEARTGKGVRKSRRIRGMAAA